MLSAHYELFYPVIVDKERLCNYTFISVYAQKMTHRGPMGDNEKISHNIQICLFQGEKKEYYTRLKAQIKVTTIK